MIGQIGRGNRPPKQTTKEEAEEKRRREDEEEEAEKEKTNDGRATADAVAREVSRGWVMLGLAKVHKVEDEEEKTERAAAKRQLQLNQKE